MRSERPIPGACGRTRAEWARVHARAHRANLVVEVSRAYVWPRRTPPRAARSSRSGRVAGGHAGAPDCPVAILTVYRGRLGTWAHFCESQIIGHGHYIWCVAHEESILGGCEVDYIVCVPDRPTLPFAGASSRPGSGRPTDLPPGAARRKLYGLRVGTVRPTDPPERR